MTPQDAQVGTELPQALHVCDNVQLFFYNAVLWNAHRIHYDLPYATEDEGYPGLVVAGPLMGDWMAQVVDHWIDGQDAVFSSIEYSNRAAAYVGDQLTAGGTVTAVDGDVLTVELFVKNADGDVIAPGTATVTVRRG